MNLDFICGIRPLRLEDLEDDMDDTDESELILERFKNTLLRSIQCCIYALEKI